jgi:hypothetical protein
LPPWSPRGFSPNSAGLGRAPDGTVSFLARADNQYVCADNAGAAPLIANRTAIGPWEQFDLITN